MAERSLLHYSKLTDFRDWAVKMMYQRLVGAFRLFLGCFKVLFHGHYQGEGIQCEEELEEDEFGFIEIVRVTALKELPQPVMVRIFFSGKINSVSAFYRSGGPKFSGSHYLGHECATVSGGSVEILVSPKMAKGCYLSIIARTDDEDSRLITAEVY